VVRARFALALAVLALPTGGCARRGGADESAVESPHPIRFAIEVDAATAGPIYVQLNRSDPVVGWVHASRGAERIDLQERCAIPDCGTEPAVCGAAIPLVRDIAADGAARGVEFVWDGLMSVVDSAARCETRRPAPPGSYVARFCYAREAETTPGGDASRAVPGRVVRPVCVEQPFTLEDREVVLGI
jgi:hypothetical protein